MLRTVWIIAVLIYKIFLHLIGLILAFLIRKIEIDTLNDFWYSVPITWFSSFLLILLIFIFLATTDNPDLNNLAYTMIALTAVMQFLALTFIPKVINPLVIVFTVHIITSMISYSR